MQATNDWMRHEGIKAAFDGVPDELVHDSEPRSDSNSSSSYTTTSDDDDAAR